MTDIININDNHQRPLQDGDNGSAPALTATPVTTCITLLTAQALLGHSATQIYAICTRYFRY